MTIDTSWIPIEADPLRQRMTGWTNPWPGHPQGMAIDVPFMTEIAPNLWQGGCQDGLVLPEFIQHLLSLYQWEKYTVTHKLRTSRTVLMYDSLDQATGQVGRWARWVNARRKTGPVLSSSTARPGSTGPA